MKSRVAARRIFDALERHYPDADTELAYRTPFELLVATILSAQSTDQRVNLVTPALFAQYPDARARSRRPTRLSSSRSSCPRGSSARSHAR